MASDNNQHAAPAAGVWTESRQQVKRGKAAAPMGVATCSAVAALQQRRGRMVWTHITAVLFQCCIWRQQCHSSAVFVLDALATMMTCWKQSCFPPLRCTGQWFSRSVYSRVPHANPRDFQFFQSSACLLALSLSWWWCWWRCWWHWWFDCWLLSYYYCYFPDCCLVQPSTSHVTFALGSIIPCFDPMSLATSYQTICRQLCHMDRIPYAIVFHPGCRIDCITNSWRCPFSHSATWWLWWHHYSNQFTFAHLPHPDQGSLPIFGDGGGCRVTKPPLTSCLSTLQKHIVNDKYQGCN